MTDLLSELEAVVTAFDRYAGEYSQAELIEASNREAKFLRAHHAEIAAAVRDAERYRWLRNAESRAGFWIAFGEIGNLSQWTGSHADREIDAAMRQEGE